MCHLCTFNVDAILFLVAIPSAQLEITYGKSVR